MTSLYYNTSATIRTCGIIRGVKKLGNVCDVLTLETSELDYAYDSSNKQFVNNYVDNYYTFPKNNSYEKINTKKEKKQNVIKKIVKNIYNFFAIYDGQKINCNNVEKVKLDFNDYDKIISFSDPKSSHLIVLKLLKQKKINNIHEKWIQCWGDPWLLDISNKSNKKDFLIRKEESKILSLGNKIIYTSPFTLIEQKRLYPKYGGKMEYVNQCVKDLIRNETLDINKKEFKLGYFGAYHSNIRNIIPLYDYANKFRIPLEIYGRSNLKLDTTEFVKVMDNIPASEIEKKEDEVSVLICLCNKEGTQIPGKIYYDAIYKKPIILILDGKDTIEFRKYFSTFNRYILCDNTIESISKAVDFIKENYQECVDEIKLDEKFSDIYCAKKILS